jgi:DNA invertase Pin-like site-specific DNA recombinase
VSAFAYIRKSSMPGVTSVSFDMQERAVRELAERHGDLLEGILSDLGRSGGTTARRPGYRQVVDAIESGEATVLYSYSLSRLSRSLLDFADLVERCKARGIPIRLVVEGSIDYATATGRAFASMAAVFAQMERELAVERNTAAVAQRVARGDYVGRVPYGMALVRGRLVPNRDEPTEPILAAFREAGSFGGTARLLNARGVPSKGGKPWTHGVVADVLRRVAPPDLAVPLALGRAGAQPLAGAMFSGLLRCHCGATLTPRKDDGAPSGVSGYYCSPSYRVPGHGRMHVAERVILEWAKAEAARLAIPAEDAEFEEVDAAARADLAARRTRVQDGHESGLYTAAEARERLARIEGDLAALDSRRYVRPIEGIDWSKSPAGINAALRALWSRVELDADLHPVRAEWTVPEWRAA